MSSKRLRVAIDARYLSHGLVGGVHTYVRSLTGALLESDAPHDYDLWFDDKAPFDAPDLPAGSRTRILRWKNPVNSLRNDFRLGAMMRHAGADVAHFPANYGFAPAGIPTVVTLHDAINILPLREIIRGHEKKPRTLAMMTYLHLVTRRSLGRRPFIITVSQHARREILRHSDLKPDQVGVVYSAAGDAFRLLDERRVREERARLHLRDHVLLADAIKNPATTLQAYRRLPAKLRARTSLVYFTRREPHPDVSDAARAGECLVIERPSTGYLALLYNLADLFVFPSYYEGFGLPALEAMACGTPVIGSSAGSIPEIVADAGLIVANPDDHEAFSVQIAATLSNSALLRDMQRAALERASAFSWDRTAEETQRAYLSAIQWSLSNASREHGPLPVRA